MKETKCVYETEPVFRKVRPGSLRYGGDYAPIIMDGISVLKADFRSKGYDCLVPEDRGVMENRRFAYPVFLPSLSSAGREFRDVVIILNGLNESEYRKFFPWAATLAANGIPALVFPIAFLINRRPRSWFSPSVVKSTLESRGKIEGNRTATLYNAVLSERLYRRPERFFLAGLETYQDLLELARDIHCGTFALHSGGGGEVLMPFSEGARVHFLGYSLGGYLSLTLLLSQGENEVFKESRVNIFCSGSPLKSLDSPESDGNGHHHATNPESPLILDRAASERIAAFYNSAEAYPFMDTPPARAFRSVLLPGDAISGTEMKRLRPRVNVIASEDDVVIPIEGVRDNLGWIDVVINTGAHEYPFNIRSVREPGMERMIAKCFNVDPEWRPAFAKFMGVVVGSVAGL